MNRKQKGRRIAAAAVAGVIIPLTGVAAAPADAAYTGHVYISFPTWLGNCPFGGHVTAIMAAVDDTWATRTPDVGDDLIYPLVYMRQRDMLNAHVTCSAWWGNYDRDVLGVVFYPTRNGQTFWVGPGGTHSHN